MEAAEESLKPKILFCFSELSVEIRSLDSTAILKHILVYLPNSRAAS